MTDRLYATAALGTEDLLTAELRALGFSGFRRGRGRGGVGFAAGPDGPFLAGMRACLHLRTALRVLWPLATFPVTDADALHAGAAAVEWERFLTPGNTFAVSATTGAAPPLAHGPFLALRVKDAVVDRLRAHAGARPNVDRHDPDVRLFVHLAPPDRDARDAAAIASVGLDFAGDGMHARGYRVAQTEAPLRETLAAAMLLAAGWHGDQPLVDPMCGSGTLAIEAALIACRIAPGLASPRRRRFGFQGWPTFGDAERVAWTRLVDEATAQARPRAQVPIIGADRDPDAVAIARANAAAAGPAVAASIEWRVADVRTLTPIDPPAAIVSNPPYGERLGSSTELKGFWRSLGARLRTLDGHTAFLLCGSPEMIRGLGMRASWQRRLMNGPIPVTLCRFELGRGGGKRGRR